MGRILRRTILITALLGLSAGSVACFPSYAELAWIAHAESAPPAPLVEIIPPAPYPDYVWINGYWWWSGSSYVWIRGHWSAPPRIGLVWVPSGWILYNGYYHFVAGYWSHHHHARERVHYVHPIPRPHIEHGTRYRTMPTDHAVSPAHRDRPTRSKARPADRDDDHRREPAAKKKKGKAAPPGHGKGKKP